MSAQGGTKRDRSGKHTPHRNPHACRARSCARPRPVGPLETGVATLRVRALVAAENGADSALSVVSCAPFAPPPPACPRKGSLPLACVVVRMAACARARGSGAFPCSVRGCAYDGLMERARSGGVWGKSMREREGEGRARGGPRARARGHATPPTPPTPIQKGGALPPLK